MAGFGSLVDQGDITVSDLGTLVVAGRSRARATVCDEELFFESDDAPMTATAELFATALLPIAAIGGRRLIVDAGLDPLWARNAARVLRVWNEWWDTEAELGAVLTAPRAAGRRAAPEPEAGLCFTLGVDSFHTLLRSGYQVDRLVFAHGYDIPLADEARFDAARPGLVETCAARDCSPLIVRTNLREHAVGRTIDWERGHGGPMAALGHGSCARIGELLVSASIPYVNDSPWGSLFRTDAGWSSSRLRVTHLGAEVRRNFKLEAMLDEPLVQRHLRVCWENRSPTGNCGECEKCVRTMVILASFGRLGDFPAFPPGDLVARVDALPRIGLVNVGVWRIALARIHERRLRRAVIRLLRRSEAQAATGSRFFERARRGFGAGSWGSTRPRRKRPV